MIVLKRFEQCQSSCQSSLDLDNCKAVFIVDRLACGGGGSDGWDGLPDLPGGDGPNYDGP